MPGTESAAKDEVAPAEVPGAVVTQFLGRKAGVRALLVAVERQALEGDYEAVRERIRSVAEESQPVFCTSRSRFRARSTSTATARHCSASAPSTASIPRPERA